MSLDVAVATPAFLDLSFVGLDALPGPGEERFASELLRSPGGGAIAAIGAARLGLRAGLVQPLGEDDAGLFVAAVLAHEGVEWGARPDVRTPVTVVMAVDGERSFVSYAPPEPARALEASAARVLVAGFDQLELAAPDTWLYATCGDADARRHAGRPPATLGRARALFVNEREASLLTGADGPAQAARRLAEFVPNVVVTRGPGGVVAVIDGRQLEVAPVEVGPIADTTGAGDLFCAAYAWAELHGAGPESGLRWAALAAALSVTKATGAAGAVTESELLEEGARRGLSAPAAGARAGS